MAVPLPSLQTAPPPKRRKPRFPRPFLQCVILVALGLAVVWVVGNVVANAAVLGNRFGFSFLDRSAGFAIGESLIAYGPENSYSRAILVGFLNTLEIALIAALGSLVLGFLVAFLRTSKIGPLSAALKFYVEIIRNTPLLLQLFIWSTAIKALPPVRQALEPLSGVFISNRGLNFPAPVSPVAGALIAGVIVLICLALFEKLAKEPRRIFGIKTSLAALFFACVGTLWLLILPMETPELKGLNMRGGGGVSSEFLCMAAGLIFYHTALVAEIVRAGFNSVPKGQAEAGEALGLSRMTIFFNIQMPQALRVIILPTTALFQGMAKNTSLAVAVGFPELYTVLNTITGQTGQPIETAMILVLGYFAISFGLAKVGNGLNSLVAIKEH
ncbi:MAG: ABC transporter permease subunit [Sphingomonadaceae bacterium]